MEQAGASAPAPHAQPSQFIGATHVKQKVHEVVGATSTMLTSDRLILGGRGSPRAAGGMASTGCGEPKAFTSAACALAAVQRARASAVSSPCGA